MSRRWTALAIAAAAGIAAAASLSPGGCATSPGERDAGGPGDGVRSRGPNAYDVVKMCRFSDEEGPVYFAHAVHADLAAADGTPVSCSRCHHELADSPGRTPRACSSCHLSHDHYEARELLST
jgi:hypothetical protein